MPRPPPPARALSITAAPSPSPSRNASASSTLTARLIPATSGTSRRSARARAAALSPNRSSTSACGPTSGCPRAGSAGRIRRSRRGNRSPDGSPRSPAPGPARPADPCRDRPPRHGRPAAARHRPCARAGKRHRLGEHRHRADTQVGAGASDANGDLAAVGDQQGVEGSGHGRFSGERVRRPAKGARRRVGHRRRHLRQPKEAAELRLIHRHP